MKKKAGGRREVEREGKPEGNRTPKRKAERGRTCERESIIHSDVTPVPSLKTTCRILVSA